MSVQVGKFIVIEGLEGAGKSSALEVITSCLQSHNIEFVTTREPGGTPMAEGIRECVKAHWEEHVDEKTELLLMYAARVQLVENVIKPALEKGIWVVGDRHDLSSQAYQGGGRQIDTKLLSQLRTLAIGDFTPDLTLYLDIEPELGLARARGRGELDRIETASLDFFKRTRERYLDLVAQDTTKLTINAMQSMDKVHQDISSHLQAFIQS